MILETCIHISIMVRIPSVGSEQKSKQTKPLNYPKKKEVSIGRTEHKHCPKSILNLKRRPSVF